MAEYSELEAVRLLEKIHDLEVDVARLQEQEKAAGRALIIANEALKHSQAVSNEWRKENIDQRALYPTIPYVDGKFSTEGSERRSLEARVYLLEKAGSTGSGRSSAFSDVWVKFVVVATLLMAAWGLVLRLAGK
jgi:hypothetical protein